MKKIFGNKVIFSLIVIVELRRRKFYKFIIMIISVFLFLGEGVFNGYKGDIIFNLCFFCSIIGLVKLLLYLLLMLVFVMILYKDIKFLKYLC